MPSPLEILKRPEFSVLSMTDAINVRPNMYGLLKDQKLFTPKPLFVPRASVDIKNGVLSLVPSGERGGPRTPNLSAKRQLREYRIPHFPLTDRIIADDISGVRSFGTNDQLEAVQDVVLNKQEEMDLKLDITEEHLRMGAIKGDVLDADGSTLINWFSEFGVTEKVVTGFGTGDIKAKSNQVKRHTEDNLKGDVMTHVRAYCSGGFWDALMGNTSFSDAYQYFENTKDGNPLRADLRKGFIHQGIEWMEYRGRADFTQPDGSSVTLEFIPDGEARFVPVGTMQTFREYEAPADYFETVNTLAEPRYSKVWVDQSDTFATLEAQMNRLPICLRPAMLVKGVA